MAVAVQHPPPTNAIPGDSTLKLRTNDGGYVDRTTVGWLTSTPFSTSVSEMRRRYEKDGYLWVKNVIPRDDVYDMREHYFQNLTPTGLLAPETPPRLGLFNPSADPLAHQGLGGTPLETSHSLLDAAHASPTYRRFLTHPALRSFVRHLTGWQQEVLLERGLLRHNAPGSLSTGIHYDQLFLRAGDPSFVTAWVPIGDCSAQGGGLMYLEDSVGVGEAVEREFGVQAAKEGMSDEEKKSAFNRHMGAGGHLSQDAGEFGRTTGRGRRWLLADYDAGDIVFHSPWMVHGATRNEDPEGRIRLSTDLRFYEKGARIDERWMGVFFHGDGL